MIENLLNPTIIGNPDDLVSLRDSLFDYCEKEKIPELLKRIKVRKRGLHQEIMDSPDVIEPDETGYEESLISRFSDESGGYYYPKYKRWDKWVEESADANIGSENPNQMRMRIVSGYKIHPNFFNYWSK